MSEIAKQLFESLKSVKETVQAVAPGLNDLVPEAKAEMSRMATQGSMELASALFNGSAFVPYGPGQYTPAREEPQQHQEQERGGMER
jgi:hypothetical protein